MVQLDYAVMVKTDLQPKPMNGVELIRFRRMMTLKDSSSVSLLCMADPRVVGVM